MSALRAWALGACAVLPSLAFVSPAWGPGRLGGLEEGGVYLALHALGDPAGALPAAFPGLDPSVPVPLGGWRGSPLAPATTLDLAGALGLIGGALAWMAWSRRALPRASPWVGVAVAWAATTTAWGLSALADGRPWAAQMWAPVALLAVEGPLTLVVGGAIGALAAPLLPAAALILLAEGRGTAGRSRAWRGLGWVVAVGVAAALGAPVGEAPTVGPGAWLTPMRGDLASAVGVPGFVGVGALALAGWAVARGDTPARARGVAALVGVAATLVPGVGVALLPAVPALALLAGGAGLGGAGAVVVGTVFALEGVRGAGVGRRVPTVDASPAPPAALATAPAGPVLDLPLARGPARRALAMQRAHGRPVAVDRAGVPVPEAFDVARALAGGGCPAVGELGYAVVVARREAELRELATVQACLGAPTEDDGVTAVWVLAPAAPAGGAGGARDP